MAELAPGRHSAGACQARTNQAALVAYARGGECSEAGGEQKNARKLTSARTDRRGGNPFVAVALCSVSAVILQAKSARAVELQATEEPVRNRFNSVTLRSATACDMLARREMPSSSGALYVNREPGGSIRSWQARNHKPNGGRA